MDTTYLKLWITRTSIISIAPAFEFGSRFGRTVILSRFLVPEEFGTAIAIGVMLGIASLVTDVSLDKFAVVEADGEGIEALSASHLLSLARGVILALVLAATAPAAAAMFGVPQFAGSFALATLVPLIASFAHLGIKQVQRYHNYAPDTIALFFSNVVAFFSLLPAIWIFGDHRAIIASFVAESGSYVLASHILAKSSYQLSAKRATLWRALSFGIPLLFNGVALAVMAQFDRALVGHWFGVDTLAKYAVILSMSVMPISLILRVFGTMSLSYILAKRTTESFDTEQYSILVFLFAVLATSYALLVALTLDWITPLIFGHSFTVSTPVHLIITALVFFRLQRGGAPTNLLLATGRTSELAFLNISAGVGFALAFVFVHWSRHLELMLLGILIGDLLSYFLLFFLSSTSKGGPKHLILIDIACAFGVLGITLAALSFDPEANLVSRTILFCLGTTGICAQVAAGLWTRRYKLGKFV